MVNVLFFSVNVLLICKYITRLLYTYRKNTMKRVDSTQYSDYIADNVLYLDPCKVRAGYGWRNRNTREVEAKRYTRKGETIYKIRIE